MKLFVTILCILTICSSTVPVYGGWNSLGRVSSYEKQNDGIIISIPPALLSVSVLSPAVIRFRMTPSGSFQTDHSWAVVNTKLGDQKYTIGETPDFITIKTSVISVTIMKNPCRILVHDGYGNLLNRDDSVKGMCWSGSDVRVWKTMPRDEQYFGFGEKAGSLGKKWKSFSMWNSDIPAYKADTDPLYQSIPFFYGIRKGLTYGIFLDNTYNTSFSMGKENSSCYSFGAVDGELNYYLIYGPKPVDVIQRFSRLTGTTPLPPKWALGYQQSRWSYYPEQRVRELGATFRNKKIPCDIIYLDIHYMNGYRCFTWDTMRFPNAAGMVKDLAANGFKIVPIIDPGIKNEKGYWVFDEGLLGDHFVRTPEGNPFVGKVWPGDCVFPDFTKISTRSWWGYLYRNLVDIGIAGFWNDMNEPSVFDSPTKTFPDDVMHDDEGRMTDHRKNHNIYGMQMVRATYEGLLKLRPNERPFVLTRANYAGGQRYAAAWTGDNISSWEHLEMAVPMCLNLSISGQSFVGTDIGGFIGNPSGELFARWLQLGIFTPFMRAHTVTGSKDKEPWSYGADFEAINRKSIELRYRLLPYIYTQFYLAERDGMPIMRPVFFDFPEDEETYWQENTFLFGNAFLVAPVLWEDDRQRDVRLPKGIWYDYWTGAKYDGPVSVTIDAPLERIPLFVKGGSIISERSVVQYIDERPLDTLILQIYPSETSSTVIYEDDGKSFDYRRGIYNLRTVSVTSTDTGYKIQSDKPEGSYQPSARIIQLAVHDVPKSPSAVRLGKRELHEKSGEWKYDSIHGIVTVYFPDRGDYFDLRVIK